jgi:UDP-N-acetylglucosamine--N-acetylmuramyl-(pentapeptide) pyrophosphoryl-undecaprenol N-acetylglucosamine transferase
MTRIVLCGGGTGGHVYPLLVAREALQAVEQISPRRSDERDANHALSNVEGLPNTEFLFIGGAGIEYELVTREGVPFQLISGGGLHGVGLRHAIPNVLRLLKGTLQAWNALQRFKPHAVLFTGGFIAIPVAVAAWLQRIPMVVYLPDIEPALSVRVLGWFARRIAATTEASCIYFNARKFVVTGYPVRQALLAYSADLTGFQNLSGLARATFGIAPDVRVVLVFGGSRGARSLNRAVMMNARELLAQVELIHVSGAGEWDEVRVAREALPDELRARYHAFPYLHEEMGAALASADLVVSRAGASTLGEFPLFGLPSVLVPYPYAWRYQKVNADYLAQRGAAVIVRDEELSTQLAPTITRLLNDPVTLQQMSASASTLARPDAAEQLAHVVKEVISNW